ncbi:uncharacterized protein LOC119080158 [Bradysia coprophila]|uniref:uncharacterized protein LOC119080158 n=1 Tax=Bradysia coprophila TaxID=38358 RepID=UPI00187DAA16|nr:uncharacterized protein LOC119080158 [Bradysia coprophila]
MDDSFESEMMSILPLILYEDEEQRRREECFRNFVPTTLPVLTGASVEPTNGSLSNILLRLLETGRFSDVQFKVGLEEFCFNCHKAIVGARSEVLATAMEKRWTENCSENNSVLDKTVIRLPGTDVETFKVFLKYLYTDKLDLSLIDGDCTDLLLKLMSLSHMYQVDALIQECVSQVPTKINARTCWKIYQKTRQIAKSLSEKSFKFLCDNIHEAGARNEYKKWDGETVRRILSLERSYISELNLFAALVNWQQFAADPLEPPRKETFKQVLLPLIRFPAMNLITFSKVIGFNVLPQAEVKRLRRYIVNPNPNRRNTSIYSHIPRFVDSFQFILNMYQKYKSTTCKDNDWDSSDDEFMRLIDSRRAEFSIAMSSPTTVIALTLHNARKWGRFSVQCRYNLKITFHVYIGQSVMFTEEHLLVVGGPGARGSLIRFVLEKPFQMNPGRIYEFHILYELLEDDPDMVNQNESYQYDVTWSTMPCTKVIHRKVGHGIVLRTNYQVEEEEEGDNVDHEQTPRWIQSVELKSKVSQNCQQLCAVS